MTNAKMAEQAAHKDGFIAALDQSGGSTPKALKLYGVTEDQYSGEEEMFDRIPPDARAHHQVAGLHGRQGHGRDPL